MENRGLLFIPDISGFTRFVSETEIEHSRLIIQELLEILINANQIGLEISEIEGDAILFYRFGECPPLEDIYKQVEKMFCEFHRNLAAYEYRRFCHCKACTSAIDLTLKVVTHYGEFTGYNVKNFNKLIGKDIIVAHQLLKNDIEQHEYWLVTQKLLPDDPPGLTEWMEWSSSAKRTESGEIPFHYTQLSQLKNNIPQEPLLQLDFSKKVKAISLSKEYETDIITLFHASGDFSYRNRWHPEVVRVEEMDHLLPRVGMRCRCVMENGRDIIYTSSYISYHPEKVEFSETDEKTKSQTYYTLEKTSNNKTRLTLDFYIEKNILSQTVFNLVKKKKTEEILQQSLQNLVGLVKEIKLPG